MKYSAKFGAALKARLSAFAAGHGLRAFLFQIRPRARLLDVGCGNNSPYKAKTQRPDIFYIGLDVGDYNQTAPILADEYKIVAPADFLGTIREFKDQFDAVISSHNIEHCIEPQETVDAMVGALKAGGIMYISFPSQDSLSFPSRAGCLNFHDDPTHRDLPVFAIILKTIVASGCEVIFQAKSYKPWPMRLLGWLLEPISRMRSKVLPGTWAYFGFESVIWARKL